MDLHSLISVGLDEKLKCFQCKNYLSYFPISICSNDQNTCGRCPIPEGSISYHEEALETLCQLLRFPCRYQTEGCSEELSPQDIPQHEKNCPCRAITCVMNKPSSCNWSGSLPALLTHCQNEHSDAFLQNGEFKIDPSRSEECDFLLEYDKKVMICTKKFENNVMDFIIDSPYQGFDDDSTWQLHVKGGNNTLLHDFNGSTLEQKICTKLRLHSVVDESNEEPLLCKIQKVAANAQGHAQLGISDAVVSDVFRCGVCHNIATPPIYRCPYDMSLKCFSCEKFCHPSLSCPPSQKDNKMSRLVRLVNHQCKYQKNGCLYDSVFQNLKLHESVCCYKSEKCPLLLNNAKCNWEGLSGEINTHITSEHANSVFKINSEFKVSSKAKTSLPKFILLSNHLFKVDYFTRDNCYVWSVQTVFEEKEVFKYEIDIVDVTKSEQRFKMRRFCVQNKKVDVFKDISKCCYVLEDQISSMTERNDEGTVLTFKVRIFK